MLTREDIYTYPDPEDREAIRAELLIRGAGNVSIWFDGGWNADVEGIVVRAGSCADLFQILHDVVTES